MTSSKSISNKQAVHPLQTKEWGEFRSEWGNRVVKTPYGNIIFSKIPHTNFTIGMFLKGPKPTEAMLKELKAVGKEQNAIFIKLEPSVLNNNKDLDLLKKHCVPGKRFFTPSTFWIDLTKSEEELLKSFTPKTRYNIRLAQKHGVTVEEDPPAGRAGNSDAAFEQYLKLTFETAKRQNFYAHTERYHRLMWQHLKGKIAHLLVAKYNNQIITAWILFTSKDFLYYPYGASTDKHKEVMANNLMMWEAIRFGKKLNLKTFDLWGKEEGKGFTKFKEGYNPQVVEFLGSWDLVINQPLYNLYRLAEKIRWTFLKFRL